MANKYAGTQTEKNLETAFAGESQARNKYTYFASYAVRLSPSLNFAFLKVSFAVPFFASAEYLLTRSGLMLRPSSNVKRPS